MLKRRFTAMFVCVLLLGSLSASAMAVEFPDVSQEYWAKAEIEKASELGLVQGLSDGTFQPEETLNRASFLVILQRMFAWENVTPAVPSFSDCAPTDWFYAAVETARAHGVLEAGTTVQPIGYITREDIAVMLIRALGYETLAQDIAGKGSGFPDVTTHAGHIALSRAIGMTTGVEVNGQLLFQPNSFATRGQAAAMLVRVYQRYTSKIDWLNGFYAVSSYGQIDLSAKMDAVSVGWSQMAFDPITGPWLDTGNKNNYDWVKPKDYTLATGYFQGNSTPFNLNVYASTSKNITLADGTATSVMAQLLPNPAHRATAIAAIVAAVPEYAGITIDFEGMKTQELKAQFTAFMTELRASLPADKTLFVCVPPDEWYKGFDYRALGQLCDRVILMAHDYQWPSVPPEYVGANRTHSPVTPFPKIYEALVSITDPVTGVGDLSKIALQISFGSAGFRVDAAGNLLETKMFHPAKDTIAKRLAQPDTVVTYDPGVRNPCANYVGDEGEHYVLWYEDARSVADKLTLARMFGINGVSIWRLGSIPNFSENPALHYGVWDAIQAQR